MDICGDVSSGRQIKFIFPQLKSNKFVYKNLRLNDTKWNNYIEYCTLESSGSELDKIYGRVCKTLRYLYDITDDTILPFSFCRTDEYFPKSDIVTYILFEKNIPDDDFSLEVDIYEIMDPDFDPDTFVYNNAVTQIQFTGEESLCNCNCAKFRLDFNHVVCYLILSITNNTPKYINLRLGGTDTHIALADAIVYDDHYIIPLTVSLDKEFINTFDIGFGRIDHAQLDINLENCSTNLDDVVYIYALNYNGIEIRSNGLSLLFSS